MNISHLIPAANAHADSALSSASGAISNIDLSHTLMLFGNSTLAGLFLSVVTYHLSKKFRSEKQSEVETILGASNLMFLCVGLTGIMILINNSLVRAFAIVAAIALVRFRVKLTSSSVNSSLLFGVMVGMSFGVQEIQLGWVLVGVYLMLLGIVMAKIKWLASPEPVSVISVTKSEGLKSGIDLSGH